MLKKVISGGQTGADIGGLVAAKLHRLETGGWMPLGWRTLTGPRPEYRELFDMSEHTQPGYKDRTWENIYHSDGTIRIAANFGSAGERCTLNGIKQYKKTYVDIAVQKDNPLIRKEDVDNVVEWIRDQGIKTLNVAGNSHKTWHGMQKYTTQFLSYVFFQLGFNRGTLCREYWLRAEREW